MTNIISVTIFSNGNIAVFDDAGQQVPELQKSWMEVWLEWLESKGVDPTSIKDIKTVVNGRERYVQPFRTDDGWNWKFVDF